MDEDPLKSQPSDHAGAFAPTATVRKPAHTEWTDERHNMYLNSVEESFVKQLYNRDYCLNNSLGWVLRTNSDLTESVSNVRKRHSNPIRIENRGNRRSAEFGFESGSRVRSVDSWIDHLRPSGHQVKLPNQTFWSELPNHEGMECSGASSSKQQPVCFVDVCDLDSAIEMSDQNFADKVRNEDEDQERVKVYYR